MQQLVALVQPNATLVQQPMGQWWQQHLQQQGGGEPDEWPKLVHFTVKGS